MNKAIINESVLYEIINKSIEKHITEAMLDENFMQKLGQAAGWVGNKLKQGVSWAKNQAKDFTNSYQVASANNGQGGGNYNQQNAENFGNMSINQLKKSGGPQPYPGLEQQVNTKAAKPQKQYTEKEVGQLSSAYQNYIREMKKQGYQYDPTKKKFVSGPDQNSLRQINSKLTRLYKKWYNASEFSKKLDEIIGKVTKDVIDEIKRRNNILQ